MQALEPTRVVEIPPEQVGAVVARHAALLWVIALALKARAALTASDVESVVLRLGLHLPPEVFASQTAAGTDHPDLSH